MFAAQYEPGHKQVHEVEVKKPQPAPDEVLLKIRAAGVCHSDLHVLDGEFPYPNTFTLGHEACGEIVAKGDEVPDDFLIGDLYAVHGPNPCGDCRYCRSGRDNLCNNPHRQPIGLGVDGAYADFLKVRARNTIPVPKGIPPEIAAVATDAVLTPYHAIKTLARVGIGDRVAVIGLGGLGINGVQVASMLGAHVIASDVREEAMALARKFGAREVWHSRDLVSKLKTEKVDVVVDFVGRKETFEAAQQIVKPGGIILPVGLGSLQVPLTLGIVTASEVRVQGSFWGTSLELRDLLQDIAEGRIRPQVETQAMKDVNHWLEELRHGKIRSRLALIPRAS